MSIEDGVAVNLDASGHESVPGGARPGDQVTGAEVAHRDRIAASEMPLCGGGPDAGDGLVKGGAATATDGPGSGDGPGTGEGRDAGDGPGSGDGPGTGDGPGSGDGPGTGDGRDAGDGAQARGATAAGDGPAAGDRPVPDAGQRVSDEQGAAVGGTVEERVRQRVAALDGIERRPLAEHAERYDEVHAELQAALTEIDGDG